MNAQRRSITRRQQVERAFPFRVDVEVPPFGLGKRLDAMLAWCREHVPAGEWDQHGWQERRGPMADPRHWSRFYFADERQAEAFLGFWFRQ